MGFINFAVRLILPILFLSLCFPTVVHIPADYSTIQRGIDASVDSDTILVEIGTYYENINFNGKNIVVQGENRETTIIDGQYNGNVVRFEKGEDSTAVIRNLQS